MFLIGYNWFISILCAVLFGASILTGASQTIGVTISFWQCIPFTIACLMVCFLVYSLEIDHITRYVTSSNLEISIRAAMKAENEEFLSKQHSVDLKMLIGNCAHDLKTPLQGLVSNLDIIQKVFEIQHVCLDDEANISVRTSLESSLNICNFMSMAVNRTIDFSKSGADIELNPNYEVVDLKETVSWAIKCVRDFTNIPINFQCNLGVVQFAKTDNHWLKENVLCLVHNSVKFSPDCSGQIDVSCTVNFDNNSSYILVSVDDNGIGVPEGSRISLFQPFHKVDRLSRFDGAGLGLFSLSKRIEALGGSYGMKTRVDGKSGSHFWFSFPYKSDVSPSESMAVNPEPEEITSFSL